MRHQQRARDRRRGHDQHVGAGAVALRLQRQPLVHAEAVLLVDDGEGEVAEHHVRLEQRVRADEDVDLARGQAIEQVLARAALLAPREQGDAQAGLLGERRNRFQVLAREHFRRRHERRLRAGFDRDRHGEQGDDRLAGADVALQQPQHAPRRRHVGLDLAHGLALRARQREGERVGDRRADASVAPDAAAGPRP